MRSTTHTGETRWWQLTQANSNKQHRNINKLMFYRNSSEIHIGTKRMDLQGAKAKSNIDFFGLLLLTAMKLYCFTPFSSLFPLWRRCHMEAKLISRLF